MADRVRKVDYFKITVPNRAGQGLRVFDALKDAGVNLLAFSGFPRKGRAQLDFVPENTGAFRRAARKAGLRLGVKKRGFLIQGTDRPGALAAILKKLAKARINVTAVNALTTRGGRGGRRYGAILWVKPKSVAKTAKVLRAS
jgi:hypothetical protein